MKHVSLAAGLILMSGVLVGCGGGAPTDVSRADFCEAYTEPMKEAEKEPTGEDLKDWGDDLEETGTPKDISDEERKGFEVIVKYLKDVDKDAKIDDLEEPDVSDKEKEQVEAFNSYAGKTCAKEMESSTESE